MKSRLSYPLALTLALLFASTPSPAQRPEVAIQTGHSGVVLAVALSPDGLTLATGSLDRTVILWEVARGRQLRVLSGHTSFVNAVAFGGEKLASASDDGTIKLWDVATGREVATLVGHTKGVRTVAFNNDGSVLASGGEDDKIKLWSVGAGTELRTLAGHSGNVNAVAFSRDGRILASGGEDRAIKLWDAATGRQVGALRGHGRAVNAVAFSPDGRLLASGGADNTARLWDASGGRLLRTLEAPRMVNCVAFSPDGGTLAAGLHWARRIDGDTIQVGGPEAGDGEVVALWDVASGRAAGTFVSQPMSRSLVFIGDGSVLASGGNFGNVVEMWDVAARRKLPALSGYSNVLSPSFEFVGEGQPDTRALPWGSATERELGVFAGYQRLADTPGNRLVMRRLGSSGNFFLASLLNVAESFVIAVSGDGKTVAVAEKPDVIKLVNAETNREWSRLKWRPELSDAGAFNYDGKVFALKDGSVVRLWDVTSGRELRRLKGHAQKVTAVAFSRDGVLAAGGSADGSVRVWDTASGRELRTLKGRPEGITALGFTDDGKLLACASPNRVGLWEVATGRELRTLTSQTPDSVAFSDDGKILAGYGRKYGIQLWDAWTGDALARMVALNKQDWLVFTPDGLFDGSPAAWRMISWRFTERLADIAPAEIFFSEFFKPGLLADIISGKRPRAPHDIARKDRRQPHLRLSLPDPWSAATPVTERDIRVRIEVEESPGAGARDVRLFRNGSLVRAWRGDVLKGRGRTTLEAGVSLTAGENNFTAYAFNGDNIKSDDASLTVAGADDIGREGTLYVLVVGVNQYSNPQFNLRYAVADAQDFGEEFARRQREIGRFTRVELVPLLDGDATKFNILDALNRLGGTKTTPARPRPAGGAAKLRRTAPEDAVVIYFAGHGTAQGKRFYLVPHDLGYRGAPTRAEVSAQLQSILEHSISDRELEEALEPVEAGQILLIIDACDSGQALEADEPRRGPMNSTGLAQMAYEKGMYILTAAQSYQAALETSRLGHGYLTYALVEEGLKTPAADADPRDGQVTLREWLDYAAARVPLLQHEKNGPEGRHLGHDKPQAQDVPGQQPRLFYRRELEAQPLIVLRPGG
ncbi:MAG TPA: caspase family protein [Pyrinomonadaceae bacterium]|jgi:WD40 repeat protein